MSPNSATGIVPAPSDALAADQGDKRLFVVFKVDAVDYALPAEDVLQMESFSGATLVPGSRSFVVGIIQLRGRVIPVIDLRARFGLAHLAPTPDTRVVVGEIDGRAVALVADSAREVIRIPVTALVPPPRLVDDGAKGFVRSVAQIGARTIVVLDFKRVIGDEDV